MTKHKELDIDYYAERIAKLLQVSTVVIVSFLFIYIALNI